MKNNRGISLITLVITIVVLIIIAGVTIYYGGIQNVDQANNVGAYTEALNVSDAVVSRAFFNRTNATKYPYIGTPLTDSDPVEVNGLQYGDGWYQLSPEQAAELDLENVIRTYIINYLTGEVVSIAPIIIDDEEYYALDDLKQVVGEDDTQVSPDQFNVVKGVNKPALIKGMVPVRNINGRWIVVNSEDINWYDYSAGKEMWANVMLTDELAVDGYTNAELRKTELVNIEGREVTTEGSMFVWIPRYSKDPSGNIVFSELYHDYTENGYSVSSAFKENGNVTGIWVSKYDAEITH
jgi:hypothetical protein